MRKGYAVEDFGVAFFVTSARRDVREMSYTLGDEVFWRLEVLHCMAALSFKGTYSSFSIFIIFLFSIYLLDTMASKAGNAILFIEVARRELEDILNLPLTPR
jgi:hypothetical protein